MREEEFRILQCIHFAGKLFCTWLHPQAEASFSNLHWLCLSPNEFSTYRRKNPDLQKCKLSELAKYVLCLYICDLPKSNVEPNGKTRYICWCFHGKQPSPQEILNVIAPGAAAPSQVPDGGDVPFAAAADDPLQGIWHAADYATVFHGGSSDLLAGPDDVLPMQWGTLSPGVPAPMQWGTLSASPGVPGDLTYLNDMTAHGDLSDYPGMLTRGDSTPFMDMTAYDSFLSEDHDKPSEWEWLKH